MAETLKHTRSICSTCGEIIPATYEVRERERVFFSRTCQEHGSRDEEDEDTLAAYRHRSFVLDEPQDAHPVC